MAAFKQMLHLTDGTALFIW